MDWPIYLVSITVIGIAAVGISYFQFWLFRSWLVFKLDLIALYASIVISTFAMFFVREYSDTAEFLIFFIPLGILMLVLIIVPSIIFVRYSLQKHFERIQHKLSKLEKGIVGMEKPVKRRDQFGRFEAGINKLEGTIREMLDSVHRIIKDAHSTASRLDSTAIEVNKKIRKSSVELSNILKRTNQAKDKIDKEETTIDNFNKSLENITITTVDAKEVIDKSLQDMNEAMELRNESNKHMENINNSNKKNKEIIKKLKEESDKIPVVISKINYFIKNINLLAMKASVESTRNSTNNSELTVVSKQIKDFAIQSEKSIDKIEEIIIEMQRRINDSLSSVDETTLQSKDSFSSISRALSSQDTIKNNLQELNDLFDETKNTFDTHKTKQDKISKNREHFDLFISSAEEHLDKVGKHTTVMEEVASEYSNKTNELFKGIESLSGVLNKFKVEKK